MAKKIFKSNKLNPSQKRFVQEYLKDQNATQAYLRVYGGPSKSAETSGPRMLGNVRVKQLIERGLARLADRADITAERNLRRLAEFAYHAKIKPSDSIKACELIGKTFGQFKEIVESKNTHTIQATPEQVDEAAKNIIKKL